MVSLIFHQPLFSDLTSNQIETASLRCVSARPQCVCADTAFRAFILHNLFVFNHPPLEHSLHFVWAQAV